MGVKYCSPIFQACLSAVFRICALFFGACKGIALTFLAVTYFLCVCVLEARV